MGKFNIQVDTSTRTKDKESQSIRQLQEFTGASSRALQHIQRALRWLDVMREVARTDSKRDDTSLTLLENLHPSLSNFQKEIYNLHMEGVGKLRDAEMEKIEQRQRASRAMVAPKLGKLKKKVGPKIQLPKSLIVASEQSGFKVPDELKPSPKAEESSF